MKLSPKTSTSKFFNVDLLSWVYMTKELLTIPYPAYNLAADWYASEGSDEALLVFMGYGSSKERNAEFILEVVESARMNALAVDLSGHGESAILLDDTTPAQHVKEALHVFDWLRLTRPDMKLHVMGTSYGGYIASWLTRFRDFDKLVLRTPAIYKPEDYNKPHSLIKKASELALYRNDRTKLAQNPLFLQEAVFIGETLLITHSNDEDIPPATSQAYQEAFNAETYIANDFYHSYRDERNPKDAMLPYLQMLSAWLCKQTLSSK